MSVTQHSTLLPMPRFHSATGPQVHVAYDDTWERRDVLGIHPQVGCSLRSVRAAGWRVFVPACSPILPHLYRRACSPASPGMLLRSRPQPLPCPYLHAAGAGGAVLGGRVRAGGPPAGLRLPRSGRRSRQVRGRGRRMLAPLKSPLPAVSRGSPAPAFHSARETATGGPADPAPIRWLRAHALTMAVLSFCLPFCLQVRRWQRAADGGRERDPAQRAPGAAGGAAG